MEREDRPEQLQSGPPFIKRTGGLQQNLAKSRSREIHVYPFRIVLKLTGILMKFQSNTIVISPNLVASRLHEILWLDVIRLVNRSPAHYHCSLHKHRKQERQFCWSQWPVPGDFNDITRQRTCSGAVAFTEGSVQKINPNTNFKIIHQLSKGIMN